MLLHLIDATCEHAGKAYKTVRTELEAYEGHLADKIEIVALNKIDAVTPDELKKQRDRLKRAAKKTPLLVSAATGEGVPEALKALVEVIGEAPVSLKAKGGAGSRAVGAGDAAGLTQTSPSRRPRHFQIRELARIASRHPFHSTAPMKRPALKNFRRIVVKVGSSLLVDSDAGEVRSAWLSALAADIAKLHGEGRDVLVVSSGSIALGRSRLKLPRGPLKLEESQGAAAVGQIALARIWSEVLGSHGIGAGQILVTLQDTEERRRYLNARSTIAKLLEWRAVPVINENDTVATNEIRYGDNDRLAARVATMASADLLILLSDIDGLYDAPPGANPNAKLIPIVESVTSEIEAMAGAAESELSRGGMFTKIEAAKIATTSGTHMLIASGKIEHPLQAISDGGRCTWFLTPANPVTARKRWIAGSLEPRGTLTIDAGAVAALRAGKSLLPAGVIRVDGQFARGDAVVVRGPDTHEIGRGLVAYDAEDAEKIKGRSSPDVMSILGISGRAEISTATIWWWAGRGRPIRLERYAIREFDAWRPFMTQ